MQKTKRKNRHFACLSSAVNSFGRHSFLPSILLWDVYSRNVNLVGHVVSSIFLKHAFVFRGERLHS